MGNSITGKQFEQYKNQTFSVRVYSKDDKFKVIDYSYNPVGLIDAYEKAYPYMMNGEHVLIIPHHIYLISYIKDATIKKCFDQVRMLADMVQQKYDTGENYNLSESEKIQYLFEQGYVFMDAYSLGEQHKINEELRKAGV
jgi:hypothetical protein